jgi:Helix-turn-helix domain
MAARAGPVAEFCAALKQLRQASGHDPRTLARQLNISKTQLYAILNGEIKRPPDWASFVGPLVETCTGGNAQAVAQWRRRHAVLVTVWEELSRQSRAARPGTLAVGFTEGKRAAAMRTLPRDIASFTGRDHELRQLTEATSVLAKTGRAVSIYAVGGMAGIGKTAFAVHAAHQLASQFPDGQVFLSLHGHTPGRRPVDPSGALASLLQISGFAGAQIPAGLEARAALWRD